MRYDNEKDKLEKINKELIKCIKNNSKKSLVLSAIGNSISNGFSLSDSNEPLLYRNKELITLGKENNLDINTYQLSRGENNSSYNVFNWIINNYSEKDLFNWSINDYKRNKLLTDKEINNIFKNGSNKKIQDIIFNNDKTVANIIILNLGAGAPLDVITRHGNKLFSSLKREISGIMSILELIQNNNRINNSNTEVYLCGVPRITFMSNVLINSKLKKIASYFANVIYVPNFRKHLFYKKNKHYIFDLHYNINENYHLLNVIETKIINNYFIKELMIDLDRKLYKMSNDSDFNKDNHSKEEIFKVIDDIAKEYGDYNYFINYIKPYIKKRYPFDFYRALSDNNLAKYLNDLKK